MRLMRAFWAALGRTLAERLPGLPRKAAPFRMSAEDEAMRSALMDEAFQRMLDGIDLAKRLAPFSAEADRIGKEVVAAHDALAAGYAGLLRRGNGDALAAARCRYRDVTHAVIGLSQQALAHHDYRRAERGGRTGTP